MTVRAVRAPMVREHTGDVLQERMQRERHDLAALVNDLLRRVEALEGNGLAWGRVGATNRDMNNSDQTLTALEASKAFVEASGTLTAGRNLNFPGSMRPKTNADELFLRIFRNSTGGGFSVTVFIYGVPTGVAVGAGVTRILGFSAAGVFLVL